MNMQTPATAMTSFTTEQLLVLLEGLRRKQGQQQKPRRRPLSRLSQQRRCMLRGEAQQQLFCTGSMCNTHVMGCLQLHNDQLELQYVCQGPAALLRCLPPSLLLLMLLLLLPPLPPVQVCAT
jgi:hypothetical protein